MKLSFHSAPGKLKINNITQTNIVKEINRFPAPSQYQKLSNEYVICFGAPYSKHF